MFFKRRFRGGFILIMLLLGSCLFVTGCTNSISKSELLNLSENAVFYNYSGDNILSLKSIIVDSESQDNRIIFEFDGDSEYLSRDVIESSIDKNTKVSSKIKGESIKKEKNTEVEAIFDNGSIFIVLKFDPNTECNNLFIIPSYYLEVRGPWDAPDVILIESSVNEDGAMGDMIYTQTYDKDREKWNECEKSFYENVPIGLD